MSKKLIDDSSNRRLARQNERPPIDAEYREASCEISKENKAKKRTVHWEVHVIIALLAILGVQGGFLLGRLSVPTQQSAVSSEQIVSEQAPAANEESQNSIKTTSQAVAEAAPKSKEEQAVSTLKASSLSGSNGSYICATADDFDYQKNAAGNGIVINRYHGMKTDVIVPDTIDGLPVVEIGEGAFKSIDIESIVFPSCLKTVCEKAFYGCHSLESVVINDGLATIEELAFFSCDALAAIELPNSIKDIPNQAFSYCESLSYVKLPENLETIGSQAFSNCRALSDMEFPRTLKQIGRLAFDKTKLTSVTIPADCKVGTKAFRSGVDIKRLG